MAKGGRWVAKLTEMGGYIYIDTHRPFICSAHSYTQCSMERQKFNLGDGIEVFSVLQFTTELCTVMNVIIINNTVRCMRFDPCYSSLRHLYSTAR